MNKNQVTLYGTIIPQVTLTGVISSGTTLGGTISPKPSLNGTISCDVKPIYKGPYTVIPRVSGHQILRTQNTTLTQDITISEIPYQEVVNDRNGITVYIAKE